MLTTNLQVALLLFVVLLLISCSASDVTLSRDTTQSNTKKQRSEKRKNINTCVRVRVCMVAEK